MPGFSTEVRRPSVTGSRAQRAPGPSQVRGASCSSARVSQSQRLGHHIETHFRTDDQSQHEAQQRFRAPETTANEPPPRPGWTSPRRQPPRKRGPNLSADQEQKARRAAVPARPRRDRHREPRARPATSRHRLAAVPATGPDADREPKHPESPAPPSTRSPPCHNGPAGRPTRAAEGTAERRCYGQGPQVPGPVVRPGSRPGVSRWSRTGASRAGSGSPCGSSRR